MVFFLGLIALILLLLLILRAAKPSRALTGHATVLSHRVAQRSEMPKTDARYVANWNYLVSFTLSGGDEIELYTMESDFRSLTDGTVGQLTWEGKRFLSFISD